MRRSTTSRPDAARRFDVGGHRIALVRIDDDFYAIGDTCTHADISLSEGEVDPRRAHDRVLEARQPFSLETGEPLSLPATQPVPVYDVCVDRRRRRRGGGAR